jgi:hypothetical protein
MLLLSSDSLTVNGVTVFPDHVDPNQFWYLAAPVGLATLADTGEPQFLLIEYAPDVASSGVKGVGFLNVTMCLKIDDDTKNSLIGQIGSAFPNADSPRLAPVPFDEGTVQIVTLNMQGSGGTTAAPAPPGSIAMVENILGAVSPELYGDNNALFALTLSEDAATILKAAFEDGMAPTGGIYNLKFTGVRPALDVKVTADLKRVYDSFSVALTAHAYWVSAGIDATFEKLKQDGAIKIEVVNLAGDQANADAEKAALDFFKQDILTNWFTPSLSPTTAAAADAAGHGAPATSTSTTTTTTPPKVSPPPPPKAGNMQAGAQGGMVQHQAPPSPPSPPAPGGQAASPPSPPAPGGQAASPPSPPAPGGQAASPPAPGGQAASPPSPQAATAAGGGGGAAAPSTTTTTTQPAGGTVGQVAQAAQGIAQAAQSAGSAASPFGVSLQLKFVHQEEQKVVTYEYNRMDAVQRTYAPQGYFGLLLQGIDKSKHFLEVDGTDPFFSKFSVVLTPPRDFATIGLQSVHVALDYGLDTDDPKHGEFVFDTSNNAQTTWDVFEGQVHQTDFTYTSTYNFDPESGWVGASDSYTLPTATTENRQLMLDPHDTLGFMAVNIMPGRIDLNSVDRVEVSMTYADDSGWSTSADFVVRAGANAQVWKLRLSDKTQRTYNYTTKCVLKDGTAFPAGPYTSTASAIFVNDAFGGGIDVMIQPAFDAAHAKSAFVELNYADDADSYRYSSTQFLQAPTGSPQPTHIHIPVIDATQRQFDYTITIVTADDQQLHGATVTTAEPLIVVGNTP